MSAEGPLGEESNPHHECRDGEIHRGCGLVADQVPQPAIGLCRRIGGARARPAPGEHASTITPQVETPVPGGMTQLLAMPKGGRRLIYGAFMAGQVGMLDITDPKRFMQVSVVSFGRDAGPHSIHLTHDGKRLVVTDYFLNQDGFGRSTWRETTRSMCST